MDNDFKILSVTKAIEIAIKFKHNWWRGQPLTFGTLIPKIFRNDYYNEFQKALDYKKEFEIIETFKRFSPTLTSNLPDEENRLDLLILMQHHGAPTRLLDWTESVLVGLFFAVSKDMDEDGELWSLFPQELNDKAGINRDFPLKNSKILKFLAGEPCHNDPIELAKELGLKTIPDTPIAFYPTLGFIRMTSQLSTFTIHPKPIEEKSINNLIIDQNKLTRYIIPAKKKMSILDQLMTIGISNRALFQGLDSLSKDIHLEFSNPLRKVWVQPRI